MVRKEEFLMNMLRAFEITNLVVNDESEQAGDKYLIVTDNVKKDITIPKTAGAFTNIYLGKEHKYSCLTAYSELRSSIGLE
jgi:hypothetical protein